MKKRVKVRFESFYTWNIITWIPCIVIMSYDGFVVSFMFLAWRFDMIWFIGIVDRVQCTNCKKGQLAKRLRYKEDADEFTLGYCRKCGHPVFRQDA